MTDTRMFGLCDEGQVWYLHADRSENGKTYDWELVEAQAFVRRASKSNGHIKVIQENNYIKSLTGE